VSFTQNGVEFPLLRFQIALLLREKPRHKACSNDTGMKLRLSKQRTAAMTLFEVGVVVAILMLGVAVLLPVISNSGRSRGINCVSNLKQDGIAFRLWEADNNDKYPMLVSMTNGGAMEMIATGNVAACFRVMSNELSTPKVLFCPEDTRRTWAASFSAGFNNSNVSYFVGLDVTDETNPRMLLSGDDHFTIGGAPVKPGVLELLTNTPVAWTKARHKLAGNIGFADGSVQQVTSNSLPEALQQTGVVTNRLAIP
jgi:prepilin-type processing-associated H-X9-DG protein